MKTFQNAREALIKFKWRMKAAKRRAYLGYRYAAGKLTDREADDLRYDCQQIAGFFPLETITADGVLESFRECYGDHPELPRLAWQAAERVGSKWSGNSDLYSAAEDWAFDLMREYAKADGIELPGEQGEAA